MTVGGWRSAAIQFSSLSFINIFFAILIKWTWLLSWASILTSSLVKHSYKYTSCSYLCCVHACVLLWGPVLSATSSSLWPWWNIKQECFPRISKLVIACDRNGFPVIPGGLWGELSPPFVPLTTCVLIFSIVKGDKLAYSFIGCWLKHGSIDHSAKVRPSPWRGILPQCFFSFGFGCFVGFYSITKVCQLYWAQTYEWKIELNPQFIPI